MSGSDGFSGVARGALAGAAAAIADRAEPEQLDLVALLPASRLTAESEQAKVREQVLAGSRARGAGRPPGAVNRATREVKDYIRKVFGDPLEERARWLLHSPASLAIELNCTVLEAFDRLDHIRAELTKLFYAPLSPVDDQGRAMPYFHLSFGEGAGAPGAADRPPWLRDPEVSRRLEHDQQNQGVSEPAAPVSHGESRTDEVTH